MKARTPAQPSSSPHKITRSPSSASSYSDRQTTPTLQSKRSSSNLQASRAVTPSRTQFRRASSNLNPASPVASFKSAMSSLEPPQRKILTADMVAREYFRKDLELHQDSQSKVAVIVHDSCYGHRFSRPRTSKAALSSIVERPERIHATVLGASAAYVRLGGRHAEGRHPPHPERQSPSHSVPFELRKTSRFLPLNNTSVSHVHGAKWMEELQVMCDLAEGKLSMNGKELVRPIGYGKDENGSPLPKLHEGDLYLCAETLSALQGCLGGVCDAIDSVYGSGPTQRAFVCIRPPGHHCSANVPSGFCWLNNVHVGITYAAINHGLTHAAIIDFDLHHGDGSQAITWSHNRKAQTLQKNAAAYKKTPIGYYSIHDINSFPCEAGDEDKIRNASVCLENAHGQSIWNAHFEPWSTHADFWRLYETRYMIILEKARKFLRHHAARLRQAGVQSKGAIFLSAGFDASEWEMSGMQRHGVNVPTDFYARFTADVVKMSQEEDLGVDGRVISVLEGGYSDRALTSGVLSHLCGLVDEPSVNVPINNQGGLSASLLNDHTESNTAATSTLAVDRYDPLWWSSDELEIVEAIVLGNLPPPPKSTNDKAGGNYSSPTHASTNRMTEVAKERRSLSAQLEARLSLENQPIPPPPDVDWAVAAYELSRLLIPSDRQTLSCRHDELNAEATKIRKERQSTVGLPAGDSMQLRERRPKPPPIPASHARNTSRSSTRRTTIASVSDLPDATLSQNGEGPNGRPRRRSSAASSILSSFSEMKLNEESEPQAARPTQSGPTTKPTASVPPTKTAKAPVSRKPKAPTVNKPAPKSRTSPRKGKPASRPASRTGSSSSDRTTTSRAPPNPLIGVSRPPPQARTTSPNTSNADDMENLANGMKKVSIKLRMPSAEENAARETKDEEQSKTSATVKPAKKAPAPRAVKPKAASRPNPAPRTQSQPAVQHKVYLPRKDTDVPSDAPRAARPVAPTPFAASTTMSGAIVTEPIAHDSLQQTRDMPLASGNLPASSDSASADTTMRSPINSTMASSFENPSNDKENAEPGLTDIKVEPVEAFPAAAIKSEQPSLVSGMPPPRPQSNGNVFARPQTPNKRTKDDLPKFTASSPIPFSKSSSRPGSAAGTQMGKEGGSIWDIPETPQRDR